MSDDGFDFRDYSKELSSRREMELLRERKNRSFPRGKREKRERERGERDDGQRVAFLFSFL